MDGVEYLGIDEFNCWCSKSVVEWIGVNYFYFRIEDGGLSFGEIGRVGVNGWFGYWRV